MNYRYFDFQYKLKEGDNWITLDNLIASKPIATRVWRVMKGRFNEGRYFAIRYTATSDFVEARGNVMAEQRKLKNEFKTY